MVWKGQLGDRWRRGWDRIVTRIVVSVVAVSFVIALSTIGFMAGHSTAVLERQLTEKGIAIARSLAERCLEPLSYESRLKLQFALQSVLREEPDVAYVLVQDAQGRVLAHTFSAGLPRGLKEANRIRPKERYHQQIIQTPEGHYQDLAVPILDGLAGTLRLGLSGERLQRGFRRDLRTLMGLSLTLILGGGILAWGVAQRVTRPLARLAEAVREVGTGELEQELPVVGEEELRLLAATFNEMVSHLRDSRQQIADYTAQLEQQATALRREAAQLAALFDISKALISAPALKDLLQLIVEQTAALMQTDKCSLLLRDQHTGSLVLRAAHGFPPTFLSAPHPLRCLEEGGDECVIGRALREGQPQVLPNVRQALLGPGFLRGEPERCVRQNSARTSATCNPQSAVCNPQSAIPQVSSMLCAPLLLQDEAIGVLSVYSSEPHDFSSQEVELLLTLANLATLALEHARLIVMSVLIPEIHHRVKNNLNEVVGLLDLQLRRVRTEESQRILADTITRLQGIAVAHDLLSPDDVTHTDIKALAERLMEQVIRPLLPPEKEIQVEVRGEALILPSSQAQSLALVINELATNALQHAFVGRDRGRLTLELSQRDGQKELAVGDDGVGLPPDFGSPERRGLGLEIVEHIVARQFHGRLEWSDPPGTRVRVVWKEGGETLGAYKNGTSTHFDRRG